jgi:hypothetical protein
MIPRSGDVSRDGKVIPGSGLGEAERYGASSARGRGLGGRRVAVVARGGMPIVPPVGMPIAAPVRPAPSAGMPIAAPVRPAPRGHDQGRR